MPSTRFIPALSFSFLTPLYDLFARWVIPERSLKTRLIAAADIRSDQDVLDVGCGTGTLALMIKTFAPGSRVNGIDADPQVLSIARRKAERRSLRIQWDQGMANDLPYPDESFDVVVSSLMIHHLTTDQKLAMFRGVRRVLRSHGEFHLMDLGPPVNLSSRIVGFVSRRLEHAGDNLAGHLPHLMEEAGLARVRAGEPVPTLFGTIWFYSASKGSSR